MIYLYFQRKDLRKYLRDTSADRAKFSNGQTCLRIYLYKNSNSVDNTLVLNQYF